MGIDQLTLKAAVRTPSEQRIWSILPRLPMEINAALGDYPPALRQVIYNRGMETSDQASRFLRGEYDGDTNPFAIKGVRQAVDRIARAIRGGEKIAIYGDYDVDGVTATVLLMQGLKALGAHVLPYIPNRFDEGYGINKYALTDLRSQAVDLVVSVDCGIKSVEEALCARSLGMNLIITDHHLPGAEIPDALAVINPKQPGDTYPEKGLAGVGLAFKLFSALLSEWPDPKAVGEEDLLDLVALGTVADMAPLHGENRMLVRKGLRFMRQPRRPGLIALLGVASVNPVRLNAMDIGFKLGPRLNAAGRLETALDAFRLLSTLDQNLALELAQKLDAQNRDRQQLTRDMFKIGEDLVNGLPERPRVIYVASDAFNEGVVGLVAHRLLERFYRTTIVGKRVDGTIKCSCRSIKGVDISVMLDRCSDLLSRYGGHAAAAGLTLPAENEQAFLARLSQAAAEMVSDDLLVRTVTADAELPLSAATLDLMKKFDLLEPMGMENPAPRFVFRNCCVLSHKAVGKDRAHLKLTLGDGRSTLGAIAFNRGELEPDLPVFVDVLGGLDLNEYNGTVSVQLVVEDLLPSENNAAEEDDF